MRWSSAVNPFWHQYSLIASVVSGVARVIRAAGIEGVTMRSVAAEVRMAPSGIHYAMGSRSGMFETSAQHFGDRVLLGFEGTDDPVAVLPADPESVGAARVWLAFRELGRSHPGVGAAVAMIDRRERAWLARTFGDYTTAGAQTARIRAVHACSLGLREAICSTVDPMSVEMAAAVLRRVAADAELGVPTPAA